MYICPICKCEFEDEKESRMSRHFLKCWKENNPNHMIEYRKKYYQENKEYVAEYHKEYQGILYS